MIALGTKNLNKLVYDDVFDLKRFLKKHTEIKYIETSLEYDNDFLLKDKIPEDLTILSRFPCVKDLEITIEFHKISLGILDNERLCILIPGQTDWRIKELREEITTVSRKYKVGLYDPKDFVDIEDYTKVTGKKPDCVCLKINPLIYPKKTLDYCIEQDIPTISHDIFGGKLWAGYIREIFPDGFLFDFSRFNTSIQILPGDDLYFIGDMVSREKEIKLGEDKFYKYTKDINKLPALSLPPKRIHGVTSLLEDRIKINCGDRTDSYYMERIESIPKEEVIWEDTDLPDGINMENKNLLGCYHRYHVPVELDKRFNPKIWKKVYTKIAPDFYSIKLIPSKWYLGWITKEYFFWMISGKLIKMSLKDFININN